MAYRHKLRLSKLVSFSQTRLNEALLADSNRRRILTSTGRGKYLTIVPMPVTPSRTSSTPAIIVEPPSAEIRKPVTIAQYSPACGERPEAMAKAIAKGRATRPTVTPASKSERNLWRSYSRNRIIDFGSQASIAGVMESRTNLRKLLYGV